MFFSSLLGVIVVETEYLKKLVNLLDVTPARTLGMAVFYIHNNNTNTVCHV